MKLKEAEFEVRGLDGRVYRATGEHADPAAKVKPREARVEIRRAPDRGRSTIRAVVLHAYEVGGRVRSYGEVLDVPPGDFEDLRRSRPPLVERWSPPLHACRLRNGRVEHLDVDEMSRRRAELDPESRPGPAIGADPTRRHEPVRFASFADSFLDPNPAGIPSSSAFGPPSLPPVHVVPGEVVDLPRSRARAYEMAGTGAILFPGDCILVDGQPVAATPERR